MAETVCPFCGTDLKPGQQTCIAHDDLPGLEVLAFCTLSPDCQAAVDMHEPTCPVEAELRETFGF